MQLIAILMFLIVFGYIVYYVINLLIRSRLTESFTDQAQNIDTRDSHYFLMTSILPGKKDIAELKEKNPNHTNYFYVDTDAVTLEQTDPNVVTHRQSKLDLRNLKCIKHDAAIRRKIAKLQPYMYDTAQFVTLYDIPFYRDWRYPERPIDLNFANDPKKYCAENPQVYPCYKYYSKW